MVNRKLSLLLTALPVILGVGSYFFLGDRSSEQVVPQTAAGTGSVENAPSEGVNTESNGVVPAQATDENITGQTSVDVPVPPREAAKPTPVSTTPKKSGRHDRSGIEAFTEPYRDISVAAAEMGTLSEQKVREGQVVRQGDVIAVLDDDVLQASLEVARRSMTVEGVLKSAEADVLMKKKELEKLKELRQRDHASQQEVDRIETELKVADARVQSVREDLEIKQLEARRIESQLEQRIVRAPVDGIVTELTREPGEFVSPSDPVIARIVQLDQLLIVFSVPLMHRNEVSEQQTVNLLIGTARQKAEGIVEYVSPTPDSSNSSVRVKVRLNNSEKVWQSGEPAELLLDSLSEKPSQETTPVARREQ